MSDIRGTILNLTRNVTKSSGDLLRSTKLTVSLANEQELLKGIYYEIGKKVHEIYQYGGTLGSFFNEKYEEIKACEVKINQMKEQLTQIKGIRECPKCGRNVEKSAEFCPKCGVRLDGAAPDAPPSLNQPVTEAVRPSEAAVSPVETLSPAEALPSAKAVPFSEAMPSAEALPPLPDIPAIPDPMPIPADMPSDTPLKPGPAPEKNETKEAARKCNVCGASNTKDTKFCLTCGRILL